MGWRRSRPALAAALAAIAGVAPTLAAAQAGPQPDRQRPDQARATDTTDAATTAIAEAHGGSRGGRFVAGTAAQLAAARRWAAQEAARSTRSATAVTAIPAHAAEAAANIGVAPPPRHRAPVVSPVSLAPLVPRAPRPVRTRSTPGTPSIPNLPRGSAAAVVAFALAQVGKPYRFAAAGPDSYDCSGLALAAYARVGISIPHQTGGIISRGRAVTRDQLEPGDLVFPTSGHVGIYIGDGKMVHAPHTGDHVRVAAVYSFWAARRLL